MEVAIVGVCALLFCGCHGVLSIRVASDPKDAFRDARIICGAMESMTTAYLLATWDDEWRVFSGQITVLMIVMMAYEGAAFRCDA